MGTYSAVLLGVLCLLLLWLLKMTLNCNKVLKKERLELVTENEILEHFITNFFYKMRDKTNLKSAFLSIIEDYIQNNKLPKNFLAFICEYSHLCELFKDLLSEDLKRISGSIVETKSLESTCDRTEIFLDRQKMINKLFTNLIEVNSRIHRGVAVGFEMNTHGD